MSYYNYIWTLCHLIWLTILTRCFYPVLNVVSKLTSIINLFYPSRVTVVCACDSFLLSWHMVHYLTDDFNSDGCFKDVLQQWPLFFVVDCRLPSDGSHWPAVGTAEYQKKMARYQPCNNNNNNQSTTVKKKMVTQYHGELQATKIDLNTGKRCACIMAWSVTAFNEAIYTRRWQKILLLTKLVLVIIFANVNAIFTEPQLQLRYHYYYCF